jgi:uncharacterized membrane protein YhhN
MNENKDVNDKGLSKVYRDIIIKLIFLFMALFLMNIGQDFLISTIQYKQKYDIEYIIFIIMAAIVVLLSLIKYHKFAGSKPYKQITLTSVIVLILFLVIIFLKLGDLTVPFLIYNIKYYIIILLAGSCMAISFELETNLKGRIVKFLKEKTQIENSDDLDTISKFRMK